MKLTYYLLLIAALLLTACNNDEDEEKEFIMTTPPIGETRRAQYAFRHEFLDCLASVRSFVRDTRIRSALPVVDDIAKTGQRHIDCGCVYWSGRVRHGGKLHRQ